MPVELKLFNDLDSVAQDAGPALDRSAQPWLFDRLDWFRLVQEHTPEGDPLVIRVKNGVARCWLFLSQQGRRAESLTNWYCLRYGAVSDPAGAGNAPFGELSTGLRQAGISHVFLELLAEEDPLPAELRRRGWAIKRDQVNVNWRIDTRGMSFEDYWATRPSKLRNTAQRKARKAKLDIALHDRFDAKAFDDYESVYNASWKPAEGSPELVRRFAEAEGEAGTLRLGVAYHEGRAVAAQLWTVEHKQATIHKLAYREDARELAAGTILSVEMFRRTLDVDKVDMIDFGIGDHPYKAEWMTHKVPLYAVTAYDMRSLPGLIGIAKAAGKKAVKLLTPWRG
jgi:CelD/BcsL family acetyltransferase involved in cellulose biosynthesis